MPFTGCLTYDLDLQSELNQVQGRPLYQKGQRSNGSRMRVLQMDRQKEGRNQVHYFPASLKAIHSFPKEILSGNECTQL